MSTAIQMVNCSYGRISYVSVEGGADIAVDIQHSFGVEVTGLETRQSVDPRKFGRKVGRNEKCPCNSGRKYKKCCIGEINMSTGIRSTDSQFTVGKANIVADVGVDLVRSKARIEELNHIATDVPDLESLLKAMVVRPPEDLIQDALEQTKKEGSTEGLSYTKLKQWCDKQGINAALWLQLATAIGTSAFG
ncbi:SEC-C metal-binding domain-containing protein [Pseudomonas sp. LLC-1]|uniref:SEC-C metal-binding domain-containing protein n=1 Tax=Pseudomonas sp. LLC-1 TaxID=1812180 RepID=UPI000D01CACE|nr:SEC-C metal-binding domain-containing protein [Pseudomonas sp. LLC-1]